ncbi:hypothetical protein RF11_15921 [Thelohanellus kitauei]|uniref:Uncharacterized protein n=1 Tax=Thelohanellus kitauei TaxID=669202 RepID=A0A0C2MD75_THEKT|nr:hypothetical protein RF11_15921 [Thelohanellus kitauei]
MPYFITLVLFENSSSIICNGSEYGVLRKFFALETSQLHGLLFTGRDKFTIFTARPLPQIQANQGLVQVSMVSGFICQGCRYGAEKAESPGAEGSANSLALESRS